MLPPHLCLSPVLEKVTAPHSGAVRRRKPAVIHSFSGKFSFALLLSRTLELHGKSDIAAFLLFLGCGVIMLISGRFEIISATLTATGHRGLGGSEYWIVSGLWIPQM